MKKIIKINFYIVLFLSVVLLASCKRDEKVDIVTTLFPHYDIARHIAGDKLTVSLLTPLGSEVHEYEPTAKDIIKIKESKLFIYTSNKMEPWVAGILNNNVDYINMQESLDNVTDLHYWTDPVVFLEMIGIVKNRIIEIDPDNEEYYNFQANYYYNEIESTHLEMVEYFNSLDNPTIYFFGHNAMGSFSSRYNINIVSLSDHFQPDAELTPKQIEEFKTAILNSSAHILFVEELTDLRHVNSLKNDLEKDGYSLTILELHGSHNVSKEQFEGRISYVYILKQNFAYIQYALNN